MLSLYLTERGTMAIHIKDVIELLECVGEARKILTNLNGDSVVDTITIRQLVIKIDKLMENINETEVPQKEITSV